MCNKFCQRNPSNERERERGIEQYRGNVSKEQLPSNGSVLEKKKKKKKNGRCKKRKAHDMLTSNRK